MSNIILTTKCQRKCPYCFAKDNKEKPMTFQMGNFVKAIDWIIKDNTVASRVGLLGGEPTLHPKFTVFLDYILAKELNTVVFTNGMVEENDLLEIIKVASNNKVSHSEQLGFCINVNEPKYQTVTEGRLQAGFLKMLGRVSILSFNIFNENCDFNFLVDLIEKYKMINSIRFGLAAPLGNRNSFMSPDGYKIIAEKLTEFATIRKKYNIKMGLDCGFTRCMFTEKQINILMDSPIDTLSFDCGPSIDIYPDLTVTSCYPLSRVKRTKIGDVSYDDLYWKWTEEMKDMEPLYAECYECKWYNKGCNGGCKAHKSNG